MDEDPGPMVHGRWVGRRLRGDIGQKRTAKQPASVEERERETWNDDEVSGWMGPDP